MCSSAARPRKACRTMLFTSIIPGSPAVFGEQYKRERDGYGTADAGRHLSERHHVHAIAGGQDCDVSSPALACAAGRYNARLDGMDIDQSSNEKARQHECDHSASDREDLSGIERAHQFFPRCLCDTDGEQERISHELGKELVIAKCALLELR